LFGGFDFRAAVVAEFGLNIGTTVGTVCHLVFLLSLEFVQGLESLSEQRTFWCVKQNFIQ